MNITQLLVSMIRFRELILSALGLDTPNVANFSNLPAAADNNGALLVVTNLGANGITYTSNGTDWEVYQGTATLKSSAVPLKVTAPASTFVSLTASSAAGGANTLLTSSGAHGLTALVAEGASLYNNGDNGWDAGLYEIIDIAVDTTGTTIQIDTPFTSQASPTFALVTDDVIITTIVTPPWSANGGVEISSSWASTASVDDTRLQIALESSTMVNINQTSASQGTVRNVGGIQNRGTKSSQIGLMAPVTAAGAGASSGTLPTSSVDTSVDTDLNFVAVFEVANEVVTLESRIVKIFA